MKNYSTIVRSTIDAEKFMYFNINGESTFMFPNGEWCRLSEVPDEYEYSKEVRVVLTIAHIDHDTKNNDPSNLKALCQLHHLRHNASHHAETRRRKSNPCQTRLF